jgi:hypothetical protein
LVCTLGHRLGHAAQTLMGFIPLVCWQIVVRAMVTSFSCTLSRPSFGLTATADSNYLPVVEQGSVPNATKMSRASEERIPKWELGTSVCGVSLLRFSSGRIYFRGNRNFRLSAGFNNIGT